MGRGGGRGGVRICIGGRGVEEEVVGGGLLKGVLLWMSGKRNDIFEKRGCIFGKNWFLKSL